MNMKLIKRGVRIENVSYRRWGKMRSVDWRKWTFGLVSCAPYVDGSMNGSAGHILEFTI